MSTPLGNIFEKAFIIIVILGVVFSFLLDNIVLNLITIFLFGMIAGTLQKLKKFDLNFPYVLLIIGFVLGYLIATKTGFRILALVVFVLGIFGGLFLKKYLKKYVESTK